MELFSIKIRCTFQLVSTIDEDFNLYFTPLFHGKACGKSQKIDSIGQLVEIIREQFERREVKMKG